MVFEVRWVYLGARFYDSANGRFNRLDPFAGNNADPQSLNKYAYTHGDPINGIDPSGQFNLGTSLATISVGIGFIGAAGFTALPLFRGSNVFSAAAQLPPNLTGTEVTYHSAEIRGSRFSADHAFKRVASLADLPPEEIIMTGSAQGVGSILNFRVVSGVNTLIGQRPFNVKVARYDLAERIMVVETLEGHPLEGWRAWQVSPLDNGDLLVETWSVDQPASTIEGIKFNTLGGAEGQSRTWVGLLANFATAAGGQVVGGETQGVRFLNGERSNEYFSRFGIGF